ncbi:CotH kinase family protein [Winogradskyella vidalii]|uniref:CotH kinase family protein n=1 Tax=Winogradskyella vidalii TaxID=2615024 RepID=UPI0015CB4ADC|nr:CotH kinase family protein [Winogradskyella vidalii]
MKKTITQLIIMLISINVFSQELYDINTIQTIEIEFAQSNWDALLDAEKAGDNEYTEATSVTINGTIFNQVGVKYKGNSSYDANQTKNPFHIELDTYVDQDYQGYTDIKLANVFADPSFVRETVAYNIVNQYMDAPQANYANVYVNGTLIGLYTNTESISKKFVNKHFNSNDNAFFSCSPPDGAGPQTTTLPNLEYLGTNYTNYDDAYEIKSDDDEDASVALAHWDDLIELTNILNNDITNIETVLDVDRAIWMLAFDNVMVNIDSYIGQFKQNYYLYKDNNGQFKPVVWDLNMSFGTFAMTGESSSGGSGGPGGPGGPGGSTGTLNSTTEKAQLDYLLHDTDTDFPLISKLLAVPKYKRMYLAHFKTILTENISNSNYLTLANDYQAIITEAVAADTNKFYTNTQFTGNINTDYNIGGNTACGLTNLMTARSSYLLSQSDFTTTQPTISNVESSVSTPLIGDTVSITVEVTDTDNVYLGYRTDLTEPFTKIEMYDDGAHNDEVAGDNIYGIDVAIDSANLQYYIYAENSNIGAFSPARAEYEFYSIESTYTTISMGDLVINEIMASNETTVIDQDGEYDDWLELYNNSSETLSLDNLYLSDDQDDLLVWAFPSGLTIEPDSYLIVWCDKDDDQDGLHADIKFSSDGESAILSYADGTVIENISFGAQTDDMGYARNPNGTGDFVIQEPTFNANNENIDDYDFLNVGDLVINEILASNDTGETDEAGEYEDWIELYNTTDATISLDNLFLSDDADDPLIYQFPTGTTLDADSYLIVWCDKDTDQGDFHADFKFSSGGETAILSYANGTVLQNITFGEQITDMGYARSPNGTGDFVIQEPTFGENNETLSVENVSFSKGLKFYPNPTNDFIDIENANLAIETVEIYSIHGQQLFQDKYTNKNAITLDFTSFSKGLYMVVLNKSTVLKVSRN